jgi:hypothetical protein
MHPFPALFDSLHPLNPCVFFAFLDGFQAVKSSRDNAAVAEALTKLRQSASLKTGTASGDNSMNLLALSVDAAKKWWDFCAAVCVVGTDGHTCPSCL